MSDHQFCCWNHDSESQLHSFQSDSSISLLSQPSLPSVPSLTSQLHLQQYYLSNIQHHCLATLKGHTSYVSSLAVAGKFLYTGSSNEEIRLWKCDDLNSEFEYENLNNNILAVGKGAVKSLVMLTDKLFSAHQDHKIRVWKINNDDPDNQKYTRLATLPTLSDRAVKLLLPKNHVRIRRHKTCTWVHHVDTVSALALSRDETLLYSVSWDRTLKIWRTNDFKCLESVTNAHDDAINAVALSDDGDVYTGSTDKKIKVWRKLPGDKSHSLVATLEQHNSGINALAISLDGSTLYSGASDRSIVVWEKDVGGDGMTVAGALRGHTKSILSLAVVSDIVCSGSADKTIRIWRRGVDGNYSCLAVLEGHKGPVKCLAGALDRRDRSDTSYVVYSGSLDCDIKVWQIVAPLL
ncbi:S-adenosyl-L-methionine-dependent methyltransferases superfamily protein isoform 1 [Hibiscus syriacus]|uniref:S-adenosyl-L-methionine-dependent methyltransferases superfamily protein isoform 1 n=1 Tax=Hibiscus syriacus TaxID=106335 RepID=A0A6A3BRX5_HIBSY|nr:protein JINGUBANG-like [Hibiscus syriacus]KAE8719680.1 S-adenosyl-L-methionine-dependent methyltransferases superfamily protein isoform 1 [Hibiscus syriacus]